MIGKSDLLLFGGLLLGLFVIMIIAGVTFIASPHLKSAACTAYDSTYVWEDGACKNATAATGGTEQTITAITQIGVVETGMTLTLSLLTLVIVVLIFGLIIKVARGFGKGAI